MYSLNIKKNLIPCTYTIKTEKLLLAFISLNLYTKERENATKKRIYKKTQYLWSKKLCQPSKFYTTAGCDG